MRAIVTGACLLWALWAAAQAPNWEWVKTAGGGANSQLYKEQPTDMAVDAEGNVYVTGAITYNAWFDTTFITGYGGSDIFLAKYSCGGDLLWVQTAGSNNGNEDLSFVGIDDSGYVYWVGDFNCTGANYPFFINDTSYAIACGQNGYFIAKLDPTDGSILWLRPRVLGALLGAAISPHGIYVNARANTSGGEIAPGFPVLRQYLARFDLLGNFVDVNNFAPNSPQKTGDFLDLDEGGNVYVAGGYYLPVIIGQDDTLGSTTNPVNTGLLLKFDSDLNLLWYREYKGGYISFTDVATDSQGNVVIVGDFSDTLDYGSGYLIKTGPGGSVPFTLKLDSSGTGIWARTALYQTTNFNGFSISVDHTGNVYMSGLYFGYVAFGPDTLRTFNSMEPFYVSYDAAGNYRFAGKVACLGNSNNVGFVVDADLNGNVYLAGTFGSAVVFEGDSIHNGPGDGDIFLAKFGEPSCTPPCPVPVAGFGTDIAGLTVSLLDSSTNADTVRYTVDGAAVLGSLHTFDENGTYTLCQYVSSPCGTDSTCKQVTVTGVGIAETPLMHKLYPNPSNGVVTVELANPQSGNITLYNLLGQEVYNANINGTTTLQMDLPKGVYIYRIEQDGKFMNGKLLIE